MATKHKALPGALYEKATQYADDLEAGQTAAADQMLAAWATSYGRTRIEIDNLLAKIATAKAEGQPMSPAWAYQQQRLKAVLDTSKQQMALFSAQASEIAVKQQGSAVLAALKHAEKLTKYAVGESLPGLAGGFTQVNEANLRHLVGFTSQGTPLQELFASLPAEAGDRLQTSLIQGIALGWHPDRMRREAHAALDLPRWRAETIMRTEALRVYRYSARATYMANTDVLQGWVWHAHLDSRCCLACTLQDGTIHSADEILDGHPRCRCAMVPRTKSWEELTGQQGLEDTRPPVRSGQDWLKAQPPHVQQAIMGKGHWNAWNAGKVSLPDMVARPSHPAWGTMRRKRSLREIEHGLNPNYDSLGDPTPVAPPPATPDAAKAQMFADQHSLGTIEQAIGEATPGGQLHADLQAAKLIHLNSQDFSVPLPTIDAAKVDAAVEKLNNAALTKGYPSKGYSQTKAVYKAHAGGTVGQPVGPLKALTLEQKMTAKAILEKHDAELPTVLRGIEKDAKVKAAAHETETWAKTDLMDAAEKSATPHATYTGMLDQAEMAYVDEITGLLDQYVAEGKSFQDLKPTTAYKAFTARRQALKAVREQYEDARQGVLALKDESAVWEPVPGSGNSGVITIQDDGWGIIDYADSSQTLSPQTLGTMLDPEQFQPMLVPDPANVAANIENLVDADGYLDPHWVKTMEEVIPGLSVQGQVDAKAALIQAKATLLPKPEPQYVDNIVKGATDGTGHTVSMLKAMDKTGLNDKGAALMPQQKSNIKAALKVLDKPKPIINEGMKADVLAELENGTSATQYEAWVQNKPGWMDDNVQASIKAALDEHKAMAAAPKPGQALAAPFDAARLKDTGQVLGTHGARVYKDPDTGERWLWKPPVNPSDGFLATLDEAASKVASKAGYKTPDTYVVTIDGKRGSIQRMFDADDAFPQFVPENLSPADLGVVQREHVLDWLLSNHDGHQQQFIRLKGDGSLAAIDKGQSFRWFGQDKLDWKFHPNAAYGAPPPVYNRLLADFAAGKNVDLRLETYLDAVKDVQAISDTELKAMLRPYAEQAAAQGKLALPQPNYPGIVKGATLPTNDVEAFLDAVVARKRDLDKDFTALYTKAAKARQKVLPDFTPTKIKPAGKTGKAKWKGVEQPKAPDAPTEPGVQAGQVFDSWLDKAKARYAASPAKKSAGATLEDSNNWARFQRVISERDRTALKELLDRQYLDDDLYQEGLALVDRADKIAADAKAEYDRAVAAYEKARERHLKDLKDWREANGITSVVRGMDEGVIRHKSNSAGTTWAGKHFTADRYTAGERQTLKSYTGSSYSSWNSHLRSTGGKPTSYADAYKKIDSAMAKQPIPEDVIVHRGIGSTYGDNPFGLGGHRLGESDDLTQMIGSVQVDWGYMSTSVGKEAAFSSNPIQMKIRLPAGTPAAYVQAFSNYSSERELILARGTHLFIHNAYKSGGKWIVEAEVVPPEVATDALHSVAGHLGTPLPSSKPFTPTGG
jgi:SPP1 gp7 family putative phage head morphogenesis protein